MQVVRAELVAECEKILLSVSRNERPTVNSLTNVPRIEGSLCHSTNLLTNLNSLTTAFAVKLGW